MYGNDVGAPPQVDWWSRLHRPRGLAEQTRWLFCLCTLLSLALTSVGTLLSATSLLLPPMMVASAVLAIAWVLRYASGEASAVRDLVEVAAVAVLAVAGPASRGLNSRISSGPSVSMPFEAISTCAPRPRFRSHYGCSATKSENGPLPEWEEDRCDCCSPRGVDERPDDGEPGPVAAARLRCGSR